jgi:hypothetical protein
MEMDSAWLYGVGESCSDFNSRYPIAWLVELNEQSAWPTPATKVGQETGGKK